MAQPSCNLLELVAGRVRGLPSWMASRSEKPSSGQILSTAFWRAILQPISASKLAGLAQADSPVTVKPFAEDQHAEVRAGARRR